MYVHVLVILWPVVYIPCSGFNSAVAPAAEEEGQRSDQPAERVSSLVRVEIDSHVRAKETVEQSLPQAVDIGPFHVNTDNVRLSLARKHKDIARALLDFLVLQLRKETEQVHVRILPPTHSSSVFLYVCTCTYIHVYMCGQWVRCYCRCVCVMLI